MSNLKMASIFVFLSSLINEKDSKNAVLRLSNRAGEASCKKSGQDIFVNIPPFDTQDEQMVNLAYAFALIQSGHMKYTDFASGGFSEGFLGTLEKAFEGARTEQVLRNKYAGAARKLIAARNYFDGSDNKQNDLSTLSDEDVLFNFIHSLTFASNGYMSIYRDVALASKAELFNRGCKLDWLQGLNDLIIKNRSSESTNDVKALAQEVVTYLGKEDEQEDEDQNGQNQNDSSDNEQDDTTNGDSQNGGSSSNQDGDDQDGDSSSNQTGKGQSDDTSSNQGGDSQDGDSSSNQTGKGQSDDTSSDQCGDNQAGNSSSNQTGQGQTDVTSSDQGGDNQADDSSSDQNGSGSERTSGFDAKKALKNLDSDSSRNEKDLASALQGALSSDSDNTDLSHEVLDSSIANCIPRMVGLSESVASPERSLTIAEHASKASAGLKRSLRGLIQAKHDVKIGAGKRGRRLVSNAASKLLQHDYRVFRTSEEVNGESTHFHFLLDVSGSMAGGRDTATFASTMALVNAVKGLPYVKTSAYAFGLRNSADIAVIKTENQNERACLKNLSKLTCDGGTPLSQGLLAVWASASQSKATRNVIVVITDGRPDGTASAKKIIEDIRKHDNVELCAVGIKTTDSVMKDVFTDNYGCIDTMEELPQVMFKIAKNNIL